MQAYLFKNEGGLGKLEATPAISMVDGRGHISGVLLAVEECDGRLILYRDGECIGKTSHITSKTVFSGDAMQAPVKRSLDTRCFSACEMVIYTTAHSRYTFIPSRATVVAL